MTVCVWGKINNMNDLTEYVALSGQFFGEDKSGPASDYNPEWPSNQTLYQYKGWGTHQGIDIPCVRGTVVYSATDGIIDRVSDDISQGIGVVIWDKKQLVKTVYWHLLSHSVKVGETVKMGQEIGISDNTGWSAGNHLHFECKTTTDTGSSEKAIDPMPHFIFNIEDMTKETVIKLQALEGYSDPAGVEYWTGKSVEEYLRVRLLDKIKTLEEASK